MFSRVMRPGGAALLGAVVVLGLTSCGDDDAASVSTVVIQPSSYVVKDPVTTTNAAAVLAPDAEGRSPIEQSYTVASDNDVPYNIARLFDIELDELREYNGWEEGTYAGFPGTGGVVRIPPGAKFIDPTATTTTEASDTADTETAPPASAGACTPGSHEIEEGDYPVNVARKYDVSLEALLAANNWSMDANGNVPAWPAVGATITIPPGENCATATTAATG
jgi:LysM repeat protein